MVTQCQNPRHPPHAQQRMECVACRHSWVDCPGAWGKRSSREAVPPDGGCPACRRKYWTAEALQ